MQEDNLQGQILIAQPRSLGGFFHHSLVLVTRHNRWGAHGLVLNRRMIPQEFSLRDLLVSVGIPLTEPVTGLVYLGGPVERHRVMVLHSDDWQGPSTERVADGISCTVDISILLALSRGHGPSQSRVFCGMASWAPGQLEGEQSGREPWTGQHRWLTMPADPDMVFDMDSEDSWTKAIDRVVTDRVKDLL